MSDLNDVATTAAQFKEELEKMKLRYRKEALKAVELAEIKGYAKGKSETMKQAEDKLLQWRAIAEAIKSNHDGHSKPVLLVKYIVEKIYKHIRKEYPDEAEKLKGSLLSVTESLMANLPCIALVKSVSAENASNSETSSSANIRGVTNHTSNIKDADNINKDLHKVEFRTISKYWKSPEQRLFHRSVPNNYFIHVNVIENNSSHTKPKVGFFGGISDSSISFQIHTEITRVYNYQFISNHNNNHSNDNNSYNNKKSNRNNTMNNIIPQVDHQSLLTFTLDKRISDIKALHQKLVKEFPKLILPPLYSSSGATKQLKPFLHISNTSEEKINSLLRQIRMWLQFISNISRCLQSSPTLLMFLTGSAIALGDTSNRNAPSEQKPTTTPPLYQSSIKQQQQHQSTPSSINELYIYSSCSNLLLLSNTKDQAAASLSKESTLVAYEDLQRVNSDIQNLEGSTFSIIEVLRSFINTQTLMIQNTKRMASSLNELYGLVVTSAAYSSSDAVSLTAAIQTSSQPLEYIPEIWSHGFYEYLEFFESNCRKSMKDPVNQLSKSFSSQAFVSNDSHFKTTLNNVHINKQQRMLSEDSSRQDSSTSENVSVKAVVEVVDTAVVVSQSWDRMTQIKSATMLYQILHTAHRLSDKYQDTKKNWIEVSKMLRSMDVNTYSMADDNYLPDPITLKDCVLNEAQELNNTLLRLKESFQNPNFVDSQHNIAPQLTGSNNLTSLRSFRAIFSRATMPQGVRRQPKIPVFHEQEPKEETKQDKTDVYDDDQAAKNAIISEEEAYLLNLAKSYNIINHNEISSSTTNLHHHHDQSGPGIGIDDVLMDRVKRHQLLRRHLYQQTSSATTQQSTGSGIGSNKVMKASIPTSSLPILSEDISVSAPRPAIPYSTTSTSTKSANHHVIQQQPQHFIPKEEIKPSSNNITSSSMPTCNINKTIGTAAIDTSNTSTFTSTIQSNLNESFPVIPPGWEKVVSDDGSIYYYHHFTRVSRWDCPTAEVAAAMEARIHKSEEAAQKRMIEIDKEKRLKADIESKTSLALSKVKKTIESWRHPPGARMAKDIGELLSTLYTILDYISIESILGPSKSPLTVNSDPIEVD